MKTLLLLFALITVTFSNDFTDKTPSKVSLEDLEILEEFDSFAYSLADTNKLASIDINKLATFIWKNRKKIDDYTRLNIDALGEVGYRTPRGSTDNQALINEDNYNYYKVGLALKYNIYDDKITKTIQNEKLEYHAKIITSVEKYAKCKDDIKAFEISLKLKKLQQIRDKAMVKTAQKYLDDRLATLQEILTLNLKLTKEKTTCNATKLHLLNMVQPQHQENLKKLL